MSSLLWILGLVFLVLLIVGGLYWWVYRMKQEMVNYYFGLFKAGQVCKSDKLAMKAAACNVDYLIKKYNGLLPLYKAFKADPHKITDKYGVKCLDKYCEAS